MYSLDVPQVFLGDILDIPQVFLTCSLGILSVFLRYSLGIPLGFLWYSLDVLQCLLGIPRVLLSGMPEVLKLYSLYIS